jgi:hypothetical protein
MNVQRRAALRACTVRIPPGRSRRFYLYNESSFAAVLAKGSTAELRDPDGHACLAV